MEKIKVGIIGCGGMANGVHIPSYKKLPDVEVVACADINEKAAINTAKKHNIPHYYIDYHKMFEEESLDAVSICTPNVFHKEPAILAMKNGAHVLTEKPMAASLNDAKEMYYTAKKYNRILIIGFQTRFYPGIVALKNIVREGLLGEIYYARSWYLRRWGIPPSLTFINRKYSGGGSLLDIGCYAVDTILYILGYPKPKGVFSGIFTKFGRDPYFAEHGCWGSKWRIEEFDVEDNAFGMIRFEKDLMVLIETNWASYIREDGLNLTLMGTRGGARLEPFEIYRDVNGFRTTTNLQGDFPKIDTQQIKIFKFIESIKVGKPLYAPAIEGLRDQAILEAFYNSAKKGGEVKVEWDF